jgi:protein-disulfide isomerase
MARRRSRRRGAAPPPAGPRRGRRGVLERWGGPGTLVPLALALLAVFVLIWLNRPGVSVGGGEYEPIARQMVDGRAYGSADAPVRIVEFSDFQCSFCRKFWAETEPQLEELIAGGEVRFEYRHMAFLGRESTRAAEAAECALDQGRFWDYHDLLFLRQGARNAGAYSDANLKRFARELAGAFPSFAVREFDACLDSGAKRATVEAMTLEAQQAGIGSTPSFIINGLFLSGAQPIEVFREAIEQAKAGR